MNSLTAFDDIAARRYMKPVDLSTYLLWTEACRHTISNLASQGNKAVEFVDC
jgi:hypothetical protein